MKFETSKEREDYINSRGKTILNACPGSGKTTTIAYKLQKITNEVERISNGYCGVVCLSFTNIAKDEIANKYKIFANKSLAYPHLVSTIDSFINKYICLPHFHLLNKKVSRASILESDYELDRLWKGQFNRKYIMYNGKPIRFSYPPSSINISMKGVFLSNDKEPDFTKVDAKIFKEYCTDLKTWQVDNGILTNTDASKIALNLLNSFPEISEALSKRFSYFVIDEAQDTSEIQFNIFDQLIKKGLTNIEFVGDPYQSLYEWREARPDLFQKKVNDIQWNSLQFKDCRRSTQIIVDAYKILRDDKATIKSSLNITNPKPIYVLKYKSGNEVESVKQYLKITAIAKYRDNRIVVRGKTLLNKLKGIGDKRIEPWKNEVPYIIIQCKSLFQESDTKAAIDMFRRIIPELEDPKIDNKTKRKRIEELKADYNYNSKIVKLLRELPNYTETLKNWTEISEQKLKTELSLPNVPNFELKKGIWNKHHSEEIEKVLKLTAVENYPISTIHKVKGKTFDSLLLILSPDSRGKNISISDYKRQSSFPNEKERLIYVAMSRPQYLLVIAVCENDKATEKLLKDNFGDKVKIIKT